MRGQCRPLGRTRKPPPRLLVLLLVSLGLGLPVVEVEATPAKGEKKSAKSEAAEPPKKAQSLGSPTNGRLENGVALRRKQGSIEFRRRNGAHWGLPHLVKMLERGARKVRRKHPGSVLLVGDLSLERGGKLGGHKSHTSGRDADVGFYLAREDGSAVEPKGFRRIDWEGRAVDDPRVRFDDARNWALVEAWVTDPQARVQHIFVAAQLRRRLLNYARKHGKYLPVRHRASIAMKQPSQGLVHDDHFHLRIRCPRAQRDVCVSEPSGHKPRREKTPEKKPRSSAKVRPGSRGAG